VYLVTHNVTFSDSPEGRYTSRTNTGQQGLIKVPGLNVYGYRLRWKQVKPLVCPRRQADARSIAGTEGNQALPRDAILSL